MFIYIIISRIRIINSLSIIALIFYQWSTSIVLSTFITLNKWDAVLLRLYPTRIFTLSISLEFDWAAM